MLDYTRTDVIIAIFLLYQGLHGYIKGARGVLFDTVKFFGSYFLTKWIYQAFYPTVITQPWFQTALQFSKDTVIDRLCALFPLLRFSPWDSILFCIIVFLGIFILFRILILGFSYEITFLDRVEGFVLGFLKGICYLFIFIFVAQPLLNTFGAFEASEWLQKSKLLPYLYEYNFLLNFLFYS